MVPKHHQKTPTDNKEDLLIVEPSPDGRWQLRFDGEPQSSAIGPFATCAMAIATAKANCTHIRIVEPTVTPPGVPAMPTSSPGARIAAIQSEIFSATK